MPKSNLKPVRSLKELLELVMLDPEYQAIAIIAARDLGDRPSSWHDAVNLLGARAAHMGEGRVLQAVNYGIASRKRHG